MSVYPERRNGSITGTWIIEVQVAGKLLRRRAKSHTEGKVIEQRLKQGVPESVAPPVPSSYTIADLDKDVRYTLWRHNKDEIQSVQRWSLISKLLGPATPVAEIRKSALAGLLGDLRGLRTQTGTPLKSKTINRYLASLSAALRHAYEDDKIASMPPIPWQEEDEGRIAWLRETDQANFLEWIEVNKGPPEAFCCEVLILTGMRVGELLGLRPSQIGDDTIELYPEDTKTSQARLLPLPGGYGGRLVALVRAGLPHYRRLLNACVEASEALRLPDRLTPHTLRHTTATRLTQGQTPSLMVAKLLGHSSLATTKKYTHLDVSSLRQATASLQVPRSGVNGLKCGGLAGDFSLGIWRPRPESNWDTRICSPAGEDEGNTNDYGDLDRVTGGKNSDLGG